TMLGLSSFWRYRASEDAVIHARVEYYSRLLNNFAGGYLRQFGSIDYLGNPNSFFYKPLSIDVENGIWGYRGTRMTGYQRLNVRSETVYYSPLQVLGFKFNFSSYLQLTQLTEKSNSIFKSPLRSAVGLGVRIRNENLSFNTLR